MAATSASRSESAGQYFIVVENLPVRFTWQDLKDLIRKEASHGVWAEMAYYPNGQTGGKGHARVKRADEAKNLYQYLITAVIEGRRLRVHLFDIGGTNPDLMYANCDANCTHGTLGNSNRSVDTSRNATTSRPPIATSSYPTAATNASQYPAVAAMHYATASTSQSTPDPNQLAAAMANMGLGPQDPRFAQYAQAYTEQYSNTLQAQAGSSRSSAAYATSPSSLPVNVRHGTVRMEVRGVFVSGLSYQARTKDVEALFGRAGEISKCEVQKDPATGRSKGKATIKYTTAAGAQQAIRLLDGRTYLGMQLKVRADTETTPVSPPPSTQATRSSQPVIVNGSQPERVRRDSVFPDR